MAGSGAFFEKRNGTFLVGVSGVVSSNVLEGLVIFLNVCGSRNHSYMC